MNLPDWLHCPACHGRLSAADSGLSCPECDRTFPMVDGIVDFRSVPLRAENNERGVARADGWFASEFATRIKTAAAGRWPAALGDVVEFGCGPVTQGIIADDCARSLLMLDTDLGALLACRQRLTVPHAGNADLPVSFAVLGSGQNVIRDAVADTAMAAALLSDLGDVRDFLTMIHGMLKPGGRALFVVPNRRYYQAVCQALAEALVQRYTRDGAWPEGSGPTMNFLAESRRLIIHRDNQAIPRTGAENHLFDGEAIEDLALELGFASAEMIPLDPDPAGAETITRLCQDAGAPDGFAREIGAHAAAAGFPYLSLLSDRDQSALSLLWLVKSSGPKVRIYSSRAAASPPAHLQPDAVLAGVAPRWSVELFARDTPEGVAVTIGGWCLSNADVKWLRIVLDGVARSAPVWRQRPDVHEVLNRGRIYYPLNTLCSGIGSDLLFDGVHPEDTACSLRVDIVLAGGLIMTGPAPERLVMDEAVVIAH